MMDINNPDAGIKARANNVRSILTLIIIISVKMIVKGSLTNISKMDKRSLNFYNISQIVLKLYPLFSFF